MIKSLNQALISTYDSTVILYTTLKCICDSVFKSGIHGSTEFPLNSLINTTYSIIESGHRHYLYSVLGSG